jgi:hypothetical protein
MASTTYKKCLRGDTTKELTNLLLRYKYYRLEKGTSSVEGDMLPETRYDETEVSALHQRMIETGTF